MTLQKMLRNALIALAGLAAPLFTQAEPSTPTAAPDAKSSELPETDESSAHQGIYPTFTETADLQSGFRYKIRNVRFTQTKDSVAAIQSGTPLTVTLELLHDCAQCGDQLNQVLAGWSGQKDAEVCIWNGKQRSGGGVRFGRSSENGEPIIYEDNPGAAEWVTLQFSIPTPLKPGVYDLRTRYAQAPNGNLHTQEAQKLRQKTYFPVLYWWSKDRPEGPSAEATIAKIAVRP